MNRKMLLIQIDYYNGEAYDPNYEYIQTIPADDGCIRVALKCPSWEQDDATLELITEKPFMTTGVDEYSSVPQANITAVFNDKKNVFVWNNENPSNYVYENQLLNFIVRYVPRDLSQPKPEFSF